MNVEIPDKYKKRIDCLKEAYRYEKYGLFLESNMLKRHPRNPRYNQSPCPFASWLWNLEHGGYHGWVEEKAEITMMFNDLMIYQGKKLKESEKKSRWNDFYSKKEVGKPYEKDEDFFSIDISYFFTSDTSNETIRSYSTNKWLKEDAINSAYERLQRSKKFKDVDKSYIEIKKITCRYQYKELFVIVGLRKDIIKVKEEMQKGLNK